MREREIYDCKSPARANPALNELSVFLPIELASNALSKHPVEGRIRTREVALSSMVRTGKELIRAVVPGVYCSLLKAHWTRHKGRDIDRFGEGTWRSYNPANALASRRWLR